MVRVIDALPAEYPLPGLKYPCLYTPPQEVALIAALALGTSGNMLEIGCNLGFTTKNLAYACPYKTIYAVDYCGLEVTMGDNQKHEWVHPEDLCIQAAKFKNVIAMDMDSRTIDYSSLDNVTWVFVDGDHSYEMCKTDTELALAGLAPGSIITWHDYLEENNPHNEWVGVRRYLTELSETRDIYNVKGTHVAYHIIP